MISIVCVYNSKRILRNVLLKSLRHQTEIFELILLDNRDSRYNSAAAAWNYGGSKANGDYIMFVHQDIWLGSNSWLKETGKILKSLPDLGLAGVAGMSENGRNWTERSRSAVSTLLLKTKGNIQKIEEVQTLDECLMIIPRSIFTIQKFDENLFDGWDYHGVDYCLSVKSRGLKVYVLPLECNHSCLIRLSQFSEFKDLYKYQRRLYKKHKKNFKHIFTWLGKVTTLNLIKRYLWETLMPYSFKLFPDFIYTLKKELLNCESVLDLGCGPYSPVYNTEVPALIGVELYEPYLHESKRVGIHDHLVQADIRTLEFKRKSFDAVVAIEVLEHLSKDEGKKLLKKMEKWARKKIILTTPNGYLEQEIYDDNELQNHKSGWETHEFSKRGYKVRGFMGWKKLRGNRGQIKYNPPLFWERISNQIQKITYYIPSQAYQLCAIKRLEQ
ncbi:MAG: glycosyltransferase [Promethearchaeota archaeon]